MTVGWPRVFTALCLVGLVVLFYVYVTTPFGEDAPEPELDDPLVWVRSDDRRNTGCWLGDMLVRSSFEGVVVGQTLLPNTRRPVLCRPPNTLIVGRAEYAYDERCKEEVWEITPAGEPIANRSEPRIGFCYRGVWMEPTGDGFWLVGWSSINRYDLAAASYSWDDDLLSVTIPGANRAEYAVSGSRFYIATHTYATDPNKLFVLSADGTQQTWSFPRPMFLRFLAAHGDRIWTLEDRGTLTGWTLGEHGDMVSNTAWELGNVGIGLAADSKGVAALTDPVLKPPVRLYLFDLNLNLLEKQTVEGRRSPEILLTPTRVSVGKNLSWTTWPR